MTHTASSGGKFRATFPCQVSRRQITLSANLKVQWLTAQELL
jgi:hypothetical protein